MNALLYLGLYLCASSLVGMQSPGSPLSLSHVGSPQSGSASLSSYEQDIPLAFKIMNQPHETIDNDKLRETHDLLFQYTKAFPRGPVWSSAQARLGDVYRFNAQPQEAEVAFIKSWGHFVEFKPSKSWAALQLGYMNIYKKKYTQAIEYFVYATKNCQEEYQPWAYNGLGVAYFNADKLTDANEAWKKVTDGPYSSQKARAYYNRSRYYEKIRAFGRALDYLTKAKKLGFTMDASEYSSYAKSLSESITSQ